MTTEQAQKNIEEAGGNWDTFMDWMEGQTVGIYDDGSPNFYDDDVNRFVRYKCDPNNEPITEYD